LWSARSTAEQKHAAASSSPSANDSPRRFAPLSAGTEVRAAEYRRPITASDQVRGGFAFSRSLAAIDARPANAFDFAAFFVHFRVSFSLLARRVFGSFPQSLCKTRVDYHTDDKRMAGTQKHGCARSEFRSMGGSLTAVLASLDVGTLFFIAICVTVLLGLFLLHAWMHEGSRALAWWSLAYLIGGASGALWRLGDAVAPALPSGTSTVLLFIAVGMTWSGARSFHGRPIRWSVMAFGSAFWVIASFLPAFAESAASRIVVSALIVAGYTFLTAAELRRERRKSLIRRWPAIFVPMLHGAIFLFPVALAAICCSSDAGQSSARGWIAVFAIVILLYVVGTAFIVLILAKDRAVNHYKMAAATDPLTGLLNRRGFLEAAGSLIAIRRRQRMAPVSVLVFDLDRFKAINDRSGHATGDAVLQLFAKIVRETLRATDIVGRSGGEEFVALLPSTAAEAAVAAERVRAAFELAGIMRNGRRIAVTVSVGVASSSPATAIDLLIMRADEALYRAKENGRNRVEIAGGLDAPAARHDGEIPGVRRPRKEKGAVFDGALKVGSLSDAGRICSHTQSATRSLREAVRYAE
jgi:diguanylate cyclase (GGDEF)-like protein